MDAKIEQIVNKRVQKALAKTPQDYKVVNFATPSTTFSYDSSAVYGNYPASIVNGSGVGNRIGNEIRQKRFTWYYSFTAGDNTNVCRFLIVRAKNVNSVPTSASTMSANILSGVTGSSQVYAPVDSLMWDVLHDEFFEVHYAPVDGSSATSVPIPYVTKGSVDLGNTVVRYSQQASTVLSGRPVIALYVSDSAVVPHPAVVGYAKFEFVDA